MMRSGVGNEHHRRIGLLVGVAPGLGALLALSTAFELGALVDPGIDLAGSE